MKNRFRKKSVATLATMALLVGFGVNSVSAAPPAPQPKDATITVQSGDLAFTAPNIVAFPTVKLKDVSQTVVTGFSAPVSISDARGTGEGWKLSVNASVFKTTISGTEYSLPTGKLSLKKAVSIIPSHTADTTGLNNLVTGANVSIDGLGAIPVASASVDKGKGITAVTFPSTDALTLTVDPIDFKVDKTLKTSNYTAVLTWSLTEAP